MVSVIIYKRMGVSNAEIAFYTGLFYLPWVIKPLWGPLVDIYWTKRKWSIMMQALMGLFLMLTALALQGEARILWWTGTLLLFSAIAVLSATHDIAADGFYMLGLNPNQQAKFVGIRSTFYRLAIIVGQGVLVMTAGVLESRTGPQPVPIMVQAGPADAALVAPAPITPPHDRYLISPLSLSVNAGSATTVSIALREVPQTTVTINLNQVPSVWYKTMFRVGDEFLVGARAVADGKDVLEFPPGSTAAKEFVISANERLKTEVTVRFTITSGNIPLSWGIILGSVGIAFILAAFLHMFTLPKPLADSGTSATVPFYQAAWWLGLAVLVPFTAIVVVGVYLHSFGLAQLPRIFTDGTDAAVKAFTARWSDPLKFVVMVGTAVVGILLLKVNAIGSRAKNLFSAASTRSGIGFDEVFYSFFQKKKIGVMIAFLLLYRLGDAMLSKMGPPFLLDTVDKGGLGFSVTTVGFIYGTCGILGLTVGGILGGLTLASGGLKKWLLPMAILVNLPNVLYAYMAFTQPESMWIVLTCVVIEQFFYGFGFAAYMLFLLYIAGSGERKTSHYALGTGFMALSMMLPGMLSGILQENLGYPLFFVTVSVLSLLGVLICLFVPLDKNFGKKEESSS